jgi:hypothetical protein
MDYRELLIKYIAHVSSCEGVDFIGCGGLHSEIRFTKEECEELEKLSEESNNYPIS